MAVAELSVSPLALPLMVDTTPKSVIVQPFWGGGSVCADAIEPTATAAASEKTILSPQRFHFVLEVLPVFSLLDFMAHH